MVSREDPRYILCAAACVSGAASTGSPGAKFVVGVADRVYAKLHDILLQIYQSRGGKSRLPVRLFTNSEANTALDGLEEALSSSPTRLPGKMCTLRGAVLHNRYYILDRSLPGDVAAHSGHVGVTSCSSLAVCGMRACATRVFLSHDSAWIYGASWFSCSKSREFPDRPRRRFASWSKKSRVRIHPLHTLHCISGAVILLFRVGRS